MHLNGGIGWRLRPFHNLSIVAERKDTGIFDVSWQQVSRPEDVRSFMCPGGLTAAVKAMNEDYTRNCEFYKPYESQDNFHLLH